MSRGVRGERRQPLHDYRDARRSVFLRRSTLPGVRVAFPSEKGVSSQAIEPGTLFRRRVVVIAPRLLPNASVRNMSGSFPRGSNRSTMSGTGTVNTIRPFLWRLTLDAWHRCPLRPRIHRACGLAHGHPCKVEKRSPLTRLSRSALTVGRRKGWRLSVLLRRGRLGKIWIRNASRVRRL